LQDAVGGEVLGVGRNRQDKRGNHYKQFGQSVRDG
jgi:hypothetical protein